MPPKGKGASLENAPPPSLIDRIFPAWIDADVVDDKGPPGMLTSHLCLKLSHEKTEESVRDLIFRNMQSMIQNTQKNRTTLTVSLSRDSII